jgi:choline dehydrogenase-like flavoprotein
MVALPGEPADYDAWERRHGCAGWGWADVAPWFGRTLLSMHAASPAEWGPVGRAAARVWPQCSDGVALTRTTAGRRVSVADCYLAPARGRPNLVVRGDALVERVLLTGRRAVGVRLVDGAEIDADLVIVSAGAIHSPAVLLRSGVDVAGVGENLHDHPSVAVALDLREPVDTWSLPIATVVQLSREPGDHDLQVVPMEYVDSSLPQIGVLMGAVMHVHSRGSVRLASDDPTLDPIVNFNMLSDERDVTGMHAVADALEAAVETQAMRSVGSPMPFDRTDAGLRAAAGDYVHAAGTCSMGAVVDSMCRVQHHENLMVCDASVMPSLPRANTHLPTVMIAERIASATLARVRELAGDS